jgi:tetratricopeptide (TPR) repeat protein
MTVAARLVDERVGAIFMLKPSGTVIEGVIEFAATVCSENTFFFIDNAADNSSELRSAVGRLSDIKKSPTFVLGERLNEWRQSYAKPSGTEFELGPLSDLEIHRLIDYLGKHNELGALADLAREMQFAVIKKKHGKQLLVVMRESTEGKSFDAILEDEYRNIGDTLSRRLYLAVCCFYQHGVYIRDTLLAKILDTSLTEMYDATTAATEGVVIYECIQESEERYGARARHRTIASVVWERCGIIGEREGILQAALDGLNLNYAVDKSAFEYFVRSDRLVDDIRTLDGKIRFFDKACQKDPYSPYVRQHYARMFLREKKYELALDQIEKALELGPQTKVLFHTKGHILHEYAMELESSELARRRFVQSEQSFLQGLRLSPRDDFCYQGLARLYVGWAKRIWQSREEEATEYISKAEEIITDGLRTVRVRDSLWVVSAEIQAWLGDELGRITALEKAVSTSPQSVVPRYLLGRAYRKLNRFEDALRVLDPVIRNHFDNFRAFVEYSVSLVLQGRPYSEAISYLKQSTLYGLSDPRFIATLGGMYFMNGEFSEAEKVFSESSKHDFTSLELNAVQFVPPDPNDVTNHLRIPGKVISVRAGYCFIESPDYPTFLCPGSLFNEVVMEQGLEVTFEPAFRAKGPIAYQPQVRDK